MSLGSYLVNDTFRLVKELITHFQLETVIKTVSPLLVTSWSTNAAEQGNAGDG